MKPGFLTEFKDRGYLNQCTDINNLDKILNSKTILAYIGFDCTADSLHVGSLLQIMVLRLLQKYDHKPIVLLGGGTTLIGDPSGKDATRKIINKSDIKNNIIGIKKNFQNLLDFKNNKTKPIFVDNLSWLKDLKYLNFIRDTGKHFTINKMLSFDSVKLRLEREQSLSYMEFNYMIIQAFDFLKLFEKKNCVLQIGGSDQWGNIVNGVDLIRRSYKKETFGLTTPLITLASGTKMGKTEKGAIWLNKKKFSPYDYWQFWRNTDDNDVVRFLKFFTEIEPVKIDDLAANEKNINNLKRILANEATKILHGRKAAIDAEKTASDTFSFKGVGKDLPELQIDKFEIENGINILELLNKTNIMASKGEARRAIKNNGIKINEQLISDEKSIIDLSYFSSNNYIKVSFGKKKHFIIKFI
tara:strand:+ start:546 stop:1787 length:1242 start_codon:yes stop_codon:yes gene_type:complete